MIALYRKVGQDDPGNVLPRIDAIEQNWDALRAQLGQTVENTASTAQLLRQLGGVTSPAGYGLSKAEIREILLYAKDLRNRYGALQLFYDLGVLEELADFIVEKYMA